MILQPGDIAIDYSFARPAPAAIVAAGVRCVCRYISPLRGNKKNLTAAERDALLAAGLSILLVWENASTDPLKGATLGTIHGKQAGDFARDLGYPPAYPIVIAVDFDTQLAQVETILDYCRAFATVSGYPSGVYGEADIVSVAALRGISTFGWQTVAWSHRAISVHAHCLQHATPVHPAVPLLGAVDDNTVLRPFRAWGLVPDPQPPVEDYDMLRLLVPTDNPAQFFAMCTPQGAALRCEWTGDLERIEFYRNAHPAGTVPFEMSLTMAAFRNVSLDGPLPPGLIPENFGNADEIRARDVAGAADGVARKDNERQDVVLAQLNDAVGRNGQEIHEVKTNLIKAGGG